MNEEVNTENQAEENKLVAERRAKLDKAREKGNAFPNSFRRTAYADELQKQYGEAEKQELEEKGEVFSVAGRIMAMRGPFIVIQEVSGRIQAYVDKKKLPEALAADIKTWDIGDIIGVTGALNKSGKGDLYIYIDSAELLTKSLRPLPDKHKGLVDTESRYRQRYVDLIVNEDSRNVFIMRSKIIEAIRQFMIKRDFLEVETPMMQVIPGGAAAKPFETYHNALDLPMYLRIAPELYLKRLTVGGMERVFEINRNFRNEGLSTRHNPEFTMLEFYWAYADYRDLMDLTEEMFRHVANSVLGSTTITYQGQEFDLAKPFDRISVFDSILYYNPKLKASDLDTLEAATKVAEDLGIPLKDSYGLGKVQIEIFEKTVEDRLEKPTFITQYPAEVSPLARRNDDDSFVTDRFEFFVGGREVANGFSELNDSEDQAERFMAQVADKDAGDDEAMHYDADYVTALEYGLPPTAGEGIGIDRLVMFLTDQSSIKDVLLFPHMRPQA